VGTLRESAFTYIGVTMGSGRDKVNKLKIGAILRIDALRGHGLQPHLRLLHRCH
jgi:hypothetical protein